jgi:hypothetical protein
MPHKILGENADQRNRSQLGPTEKHTQTQTQTQTQILLPWPVVRTTVAIRTAFSVACLPACLPASRDERSLTFWFGNCQLQLSLSAHGFPRPVVCRSVPWCAVVPQIGVPADGVSR